MTRLELQFSPGVCPVGGLLGHMVVEFLVFERPFILFSIVAVSIYIPTNSARGFPFLHTLSSKNLQTRISFQRTFFLLQLLIGQEPLSYQYLVTTEAFEAGVPFSDLEKLENDIENMLQVTEKRLESSDEDEKVGSSRFSKPWCSHFSSLLIIFLH